MGILGGVGDMLGFGGDPGEEAAKASIKGSEIEAEYKTEALDYLKETEALPQEFREGALKQIAGAYGVAGGEGSQQKIIDRALKSPLYGAIMGGQEAGEDAILRSASATGGLRSGNVQENLYDYNVQLQNKALLESYNLQMQGLQGLSGLPSLAPQIAQQTGSIGTTLGQGQIAAGQAYQTGGQQQAGNLMGMGQLGLQAYDIFSDRRLKTNIKKVSELKGHNWYTWDWNIVAQKMGLKGKSEGVLADEIVVTNPDCVGMKYGFLMVKYNKLGLFKGA